jgi:hypothetical protein
MGMVDTRQRRLVASHAARQLWLGRQRRRRSPRLGLLLGGTTTAATAARHPGAPGVTETETASESASSGSTTVTVTGIEIGTASASASGTTTITAATTTITVAAAGSSTGRAAGAGRRGVRVMTDGGWMAVEGMGVEETTITGTWATGGEGSTTNDLAVATRPPLLRGESVRRMPSGQPPLKQLASIERPELARA